MPDTLALADTAKVALEFLPPTQEGGPVRVRLFARAAAPFWHYGYEAYLVHDFASMRHKDTIAIDWEHDPIIGRSLRIEVLPDGLHIEAEVVPGVSREAGEVIKMLAAGIPLEASISYRDYAMEEVAPGGVVSVNGREYVAPQDGPILVIRDWLLTSCAICKEGYDPLTVTEKETMLSIFKRKKEAALSAAQKEDKEEPKAEEAPAETAPATEAPADATPAATAPVPDPEAAPETLTAPAAEAPAEEAAPAEPQALSRADLARYAEAFGAELAVKYLLDGTTFEDGMAAQLAAQKEELAQLRAVAARAPFAPDAPATERPRIPGLSARQTKLAMQYVKTN